MTTRRRDPVHGRRVEITGASGERYAFTRLEADSPLRAVGVTYVIAEPSKGGWQVLEAGETNDLAAGAWRASLDAALAEHPKAECLIRLNVSRSIRVAEVDDIVQKHAPPATDPEA
jgi:hypothetical protein